MTKTEQPGVTADLYD